MAPARAAGGMAVRRGLLTGEYGVQVHELPYAEQAESSPVRVLLDSGHTGRM
jgi:hypothetical protein